MALPHGHYRCQFFSKSDIFCENFCLKLSKFLLETPKVSLTLVQLKQPYFGLGDVTCDENSHSSLKLPIIFPWGSRDASCGAGKGGNLGTIKRYCSPFRPRIFLQLMIYSSSEELSGYVQ